MSVTEIIEVIAKENIVIDPSLVRIVPDHDDSLVEKFQKRQAFMTAVHPVIETPLLFFGFKLYKRINKIRKMPAATRVDAEMMESRVASSPELIRESEFTLTPTLFT